MRRPTEILVVGGGVASFVAGIELRDRLPDAKITLVTNADERMLGGQLASWDDQGYPIEHGLHALFGFYDNILPVLERVGALSNFTRSRRHTFVYEKNKLRRFDLLTWPGTYRGFGTREKLKLSSFLPNAAKIVADIQRHGFEHLDQYDDFDLREVGRDLGIPDEILMSNFFRQFYDAAFNHPFELSATVGIASIYKLFAKPWHYYFNQPSRESIVEPLRRYFVEQCGGRIELGQQLVRVHTEEATERVTGLLVRDLATNETRLRTADEYVLALGLEDLKAVRFDDEAAKRPYFSNIHRLSTVSSLSFQAWFRDDPVPAGLDSMIGGLPEPLSILCPLSRVRAIRSPQERRFSHELIACGPEAGFEDVPDDVICARFLTTLRECGFRIPAREQMHVTLRRNREPFHRYLLTRPGELRLRPVPQSPYRNLSLIGAWVRNAFALPCVDAAAESAKKVAKTIAARTEVSNMPAFVGMPRVSPLVIPPPFRFPTSRGAFFLVKVDEGALASELPPGFEAVFHDKALLAIMKHQGVHGVHDPSQGRYDYHEVVIASLVRSGDGTIGLYPICLFVDDDAAMAAGREVYGFPKKMAKIDIEDGYLQVSRVGRRPGAGPGPVEPIALLRGTWTPGTAPFGALASRATGAMGTLLPITFFNLREFPVPRGQASLRQITRVAATEVRFTETKVLRGASFALSPSANDQLFRLAPGPELELRAERGLCIDFGFTFGEATACDHDTVKGWIPSKPNVFPLAYAHALSRG